MDTSKAREWVAVYEQQSEGGLTQREFCEKNGLSYTAFRHWKSRYAARTLDLEEGEQQSGFIQVDFLSAPMMPTKTALCGELLVVELPTGVVLRFRGPVQ